LHSYIEEALEWCKEEEEEEAEEEENNAHISLYRMKSRKTLIWLNFEQ